MRPTRNNPTGNARQNHHRTVYHHLNKRNEGVANSTTAVIASVPRTSTEQMIYADLDRRRVWNRARTPRFQNGKAVLSSNLFRAKHPWTKFEIHEGATDGFLLPHFHSQRPDNHSSKHCHVCGMKVNKSDSQCQCWKSVLREYTVKRDRRVARDDTLADLGFPDFTNIGAGGDRIQEAEWQDGISEPSKSHSPVAYEAAVVPIEEDISKRQEVQHLPTQSLRTGMVSSVLPPVIEELPTIAENSAELRVDADDEVRKPSAVARKREATQKKVMAGSVAVVHRRKAPDNDNGPRVLTCARDSDDQLIASSPSKFDTEDISFCLTRKEREYKPQQKVSAAITRAHKKAIAFMVCPDPSSACSNKMTSCRRQPPERRRRRRRRRQPTDLEVAVRRIRRLRRAYTTVRGFFLAGIAGCAALATLSVT